MTKLITRAEHKEFCKRIDAENQRQNRRISLLEESMENLVTLTASVEKLASRMEGMAKEQEKQGESMENLVVLTTSVEKLDSKVETIVKEQEKLGERLDSLEKEPADKWKQLNRTIQTALVSGVVGAVLGALLSIL